MKNNCKLEWSWFSAELGRGCDWICDRHTDGLPYAMALPGGRPSQSTCNRITESERQLWCEYHLNNSIQ